MREMSFSSSLSPCPVQHIWVWDMNAEGMLFLQHLSRKKDVEGKGQKKSTNARLLPKA